MDRPPAVLLLAIASLTVASFLLVPTPALAGCGVPVPVVFAPPDGAKLPENPTILMFVSNSPVYDAKDLDSITVATDKGRVLAAKRETPATANWSKVIRLAVPATSGTFTISVTIRRQKHSATFHVVPSRPLPRVVETPPTDLVEATYVYESGCPASDGFLLHVSPKAPAYLVEEGKKRWIVPDLSHHYRVEDGHGLVVTGSVGCEHFVIPTKRPFEISVTPLSADGSEGETYLSGCRHTGVKRTTHRADGSFHVEGTGLECSSHNSVEISGKIERR